MLDFQRLRRVNLARCTAGNGFNHSLKSWSIAEWTNAMAGEAGEACNISKKLIRCRDGMERMNRGETVEQLQGKLALELADTVIYADLCAAASNFDLAKIIITKFNHDSTQADMPYFL